MLKSDVSRADTFTLGGLVFTIVRVSSSERTRLRRWPVGVGSLVGQIGRMLEEVVTTTLSETDRERWASLQTTPRRMRPFGSSVTWRRGSQSRLTTMCSARLIEKACGRLDRKVVEHERTSGRCHAPGAPAVARPGWILPRFASWSRAPGARGGGHTSLVSHGARGLFAASQGRAPLPAENLPNLSRH